MIIRCAWCKGTIQDFGENGPKSISDGICPKCREVYFPETLLSVREMAAAVLMDSHQGRESQCA